MISHLAFSLFQLFPRFLLLFFPKIFTNVIIFKIKNVQFKKYLLQHYNVPGTMLGDHRLKKSTNCNTQRCVFIEYSA